MMELQMCENRDLLFLSIYSLHLGAPHFIGPHDTLPYVLMYILQHVFVQLILYYFKLLLVLVTTAVLLLLLLYFYCYEHSSNIGSIACLQYRQTQS